jgi:hypothetical protein
MAKFRDAWEKALIERLQSARPSSLILDHGAHQGSPTDDLPLGGGQLVRATAVGLDGVNELGGIAIGGRSAIQVGQREHPHLEAKARLNDTRGGNVTASALGRSSPRSPPIDPPARAARAAATIPRDREKPVDVSASTRFGLRCPPFVISREMQQRLLGHSVLHLLCECSDRCSALAPKLGHMTRRHHAAT